MAHAQTDDVTSRWGRAEPATQEELTLISRRLDDVERMIVRRLARAGRVLDDDLNSAAIVLDDLKLVEAEAVLRLVRNPEGYVQETDGNYTYMLSDEISSTKLRVDPDEWETLGIFGRRVFSIMPTIDMPT